VIKIAVDENFDHHILRALLRRIPELDFRTVQSQGMTGADDPDVLAWAATEERVLLTHDVRTVTGFAYERVARNDAMPGVIEVPCTATTSDVLEDLILIVMCAEADDCRDQVIYLPWQRPG
jgi:predicted nuclease of predicted toxin-antitoxin system